MKMNESSRVQDKKPVDNNNRLSMRIRGMKGELEKLGENAGDILPVSKIQTQILRLTNGTVNIMDALDPTKFKSTYEIMEGISKVWTDISEVSQAKFCLYVQKCA